MDILYPSEVFGAALTRMTAAGEDPDLPSPLQPPPPPVAAPPPPPPPPPPPLPKTKLKTKSANSLSAAKQEGYEYRDGGFVPKAATVNPLACALAAAIEARSKRPPASRSRTCLTVVGGLTFDSDFDTGNLGHVAQSGASSFIVWTRRDCEGTRYVARSRTWFHFSVQGATPGSVLRIEVRGMNPQARLFQHDMRPVYRTLPTKPEWTRIKTPTPFTMEKGAEDSFAIHIAHTVDSPNDDTIYFAFTYPHLYSECMARFAPCAPLKMLQPSLISLWRK